MTRLTGEPHRELGTCKDQPARLGLTEGRARGLPEHEPPVFVDGEGDVPLLQLQQHACGDAPDRLIDRHQRTLDPVRLESRHDRVSQASD